MKIITSNPGKVREYKDALSSFGIDVQHMSVAYDEIQTSELTEVIDKGMEYLKASGISDFIIDDSGLFIDALNGFPGVYSSYVLKTIGNAGILKLMENVNVRTANFQCCIGCNIDGKDMIATGRCDGTILRKEIGKEGFGYDPIFSPDGKRSFAEIPLKEKNKLSHRGIAVQLLMDMIKKRV